MGRDFLLVQTDRGAHPASCTMGIESFQGVKYGRGVLLTTHSLLVPRSWKCRAIPLPTLWATTGPVTGTLYLYLYLLIYCKWNFLNSKAVGHKTIEAYLVDKNKKFLIHITQFVAYLFVELLDLSLSKHICFELSLLWKGCGRIGRMRTKLIPQINISYIS